MKKTAIILGAAFASLWLGSAAAAVALPPVGPNPSGPKSTTSSGALQVFSSRVLETGDYNQGAMDPAWLQHSGYYLYDLDGRLLRHVAENVGEYAQAPRHVILPAGQYILEARSTDYGWLKVPVTIKSGRNTNVHLDDQWMPPLNQANGKVVSLPNGKPVGWVVNAAT